MKNTLFADSNKPMPDCPLQRWKIRADSAFDEARRVLELESLAIRSVAANLGDSFVAAVHAILECKRYVIVSGIGKSGIIAQKISATFASTGTPSHYLHAAEAIHGDLGRVGAGDVVLLFSYSGATEEVVSLAVLARSHGVSTISISRSDETPLARACDISLPLGNIREACQYNLAPTASTTGMLALGDALAMVLCKERGFTESDFHRCHPGGRLGRLLSPLSSILTRYVHSDVSVVPRDATLGFVLEQTRVTSRRAGATLVVDSRGALSGIFTDADLRRLISSSGTVPLKTRMDAIMTADPKTLFVQQPIRDAVELFQTFQIDEIPIVNHERVPVGIVDIQDLIVLNLVDVKGPLGTPESHA